MKLEAGMYVRTKKGTIYKFDTNNSMAKNGAKKYMVNCSFNIIDLIEPMDLMFIDISPDDCGGIVVPRVSETLNELNKWKERFASGECILKAVLTKEQIINNWYEVNNYGIMD